MRIFIEKSVILLYIPLNQVIRDMMITKLVQVQGMADVKRRQAIARSSEETTVYLARIHRVR